MSQFLLKTMEYGIYAALAAMLSSCSVILPRVPAYAFDNDNAMYLSYVEQVPVDSTAVTAPAVSNTVAPAALIDAVVGALPALAEAQAEYTSKTTVRSVEIFVSNTNALSEASIAAILQAFNESIVSR